ncbi:MAG TPA: serine hydrolase domain-containing protein [Vicinamibacterales bacterium]|nr:serine hydrolase domain-containing protein [Vicinamibacterales bacterium]
MSVRRGCLLLALALATESAAQDAPTAIAGEAAKRIDAVFAPWDNARSPGCALGVARAGIAIYTHGYGVSNLEYDLAITPASVFHIGSVSKQFTAFAIGLLAREGKLSLDDDVRRYLPELPDYGTKVTLRHLLMHTGGYRDYWTLLRRGGWRPEDMVNENDVLRILARQKALNFQPGTEFLYSNTGYTLLAIVVKRASGQSLRDFASTRIFSPLGMRDTSIQDDHTQIVRGRTSAYEPRLGGGFRISIPITDTSGATNLFTTVGDLLKWQENLLDGRVGGKTLVDEMQRSGRLNDGTATGYGSGLLMETFRGIRIVDHSGSEAGYRAEAARFPDQDLNIVVLCNLSTINARVLARKVAGIVLGPRVVEPLPQTFAIAPGEGERIVGTYWNAHTAEVWRILMKDGQLVTDASGDPLVSLGGGRYRLGEQSTELKFTVANAEASVEVNAPVITPATFTRVVAPKYSPAELQAYAGEYCGEEVQAIYRISVSGEGSLSVLRSKYDPLTLEGVKRDTFSSRRLGTLTFTHTPSGAVTGFSMSAGSTRGLQFTRLEAEQASRACGL